MNEVVSTPARISRRGMLMGIATSTLSAVAASARSHMSQRGNFSDYPLTAVPLSRVSIEDAFWAAKIENARSVALPLMLKEAERAPEHTDCRLIEAASYFLLKRSDSQLRNSVEALSDPVIRRMRSLEGVWPNKGDGPFLDVGHFFEAAVADYEASGNRKLLNAAIEVADDLNANYGPN